MGTREIDRCPFCTCAAKVFFTKNPAYYGVACMGCTAKVYGYVTKDMAIDAWNRRDGKKKGRR